MKKKKQQLQPLPVLPPPLLPLLPISRSPPLLLSTLLRLALGSSLSIIIPRLMSLELSTVLSTLLGKLRKAQMARPIFKAIPSLLNLDFVLMILKNNKMFLAMYFLNFYIGARRATT